MALSGQSNDMKRPARFRRLAVAILPAMLLLAGSSLAAADDAAKKTAAAAQSGGETAGAEAEAPAKFTKEFLNDPAVIEAGKGVWHEQCRHCHGHAAYPGKAPKLKPGKLTPDFVYDRVTNGFRKMPSWSDVFSRQERMSVAAYVLSKSFSP